METRHKYSRPPLRGPAVVFPNPEDQSSGMTVMPLAISAPPLMGLQ